MPAPNWTDIFGPPTRRSIFISYHHQGDQGYYDRLVTTFSESYELLRDNSLERRIQSDNVEYILQRIREDYITGSSCTLVLCGAETPWRKFVDWEIKATLDKEHGLIGVNLPSNPLNPSNTVNVPSRLYDNIQSRYAIWSNWTAINSDLTTLPSLIEQANNASIELIRNHRPMM